MDNVLLPLLYDRSDRFRALRTKAVEALKRVDLGHRLGHEPKVLSGVQQQRVAIARVLVHESAVVLADEPTGSLDTRTTLEVMALLQELNEAGITILVVTREAEVAACTRRIIQLRDGRPMSDKRVRDRRDAGVDLAADPVADELP